MHKNMQNGLQMKRIEVNGVVTWSFTHQAFIRLKILKTDFGSKVEIRNL